MEPLKSNESNNNSESKNARLHIGQSPLKPSAAFIGASWMTLLIGMTSYCIGLYNSDMAYNEKGYYSKNSVGYSPELGFKSFGRNEKIEKRKKL